MSTETTLTVVGMTCGHCVNAVQQELSTLDGVSDVRIDLESGRVEVTSAGVLDPSASHRPSKRRATSWRPEPN